MTNVSWLVGPHVAIVLHGSSPSSRSVGCSHSARPSKPLRHPGPIRTHPAGHRVTFRSCTKLTTMLPPHACWHVPDAIANPRPAHSQLQPEAWLLSPPENPRIATTALAHCSFGSLGPPGTLAMEAFRGAVWSLQP